ncbi:DUF4153 domain-containing protein [Hymenobacter aerilatus]|uniref:DUF4153 domain-containing protein n=1 Tax=Hymenobacter aerilatus TaxID=2932251 RepID=A0A8T9T602_9BACT|nr:DUF4153 domain-containing protein [Hymenobacter aerilatus]UOR07506.1 DUF4153 domain-containing protein [Hymenobacter aerilatus]
MKLPSLQHLAAEAARVVRRFPLTLLCAFVLCGVGIYVIHLDNKAQQQLDWLFPTLSAAGLGLSSTLAVALATERWRWQPAGRWGAQAVVLALLVLWYALAPTQPNLEWGMRLALLLLGMHLAVAAGPYLPELRRSADTPGFWRYNETLFLRILLAGIYSGVLFAGCALALVAIDNLFDVKLDEHLFGYLFVTLATVFNTWFFLAGVPSDFEQLEQAAPYPKALKLFTQFVLLPLVVLYLVILYAYLGRILVQWELPKGWVSILILAFSVAGIFALLLIHPIRHAAENTWIRTFARWFYRALFPLLGLLAVAIGTRIRDYGITEERYFVLVLAAWLFCMAVYFLVRRGQGIIWIPASLAVVALLSAAGPWSAFAVAQRSQLKQLREISTEYGLLKGGKLDGAGQRVPKLPLQVRQRITSIFEFFTDRDATRQLQPFFTASLALPDSLQKQEEWKQRQWQQEQPFAVSDIQRVSRYATAADDERTANFFNGAEDFDLGEGRYWLGNVEHYQYNKKDSTLTSVTTRAGVFRLRAGAYGRQLLLEQQVNHRWQIRLTLSPGAFADSLTRIHGFKAENEAVSLDQLLHLRAATGKTRLHLFLQSLRRSEKQDTISYDYSGHALLEVGEK